MRPFNAFCVFLCATVAAADEPCKSGLRESQRPGPYTALVSVGRERGQQHCYICESGQKPLIIIFARQLSDPLGKLVSTLNKAVAEQKATDLRAWVTFLTDDQVSLDPKVVGWSKKHATGGIPLGVFEDPIGPPAYLLSRDADVTVLLAVKQKVAANFAYRAGELNDAAIFEIVGALPKILEQKK
jgi:hypothetical protein